MNKCHSDTGVFAEKLNHFQMMKCLQDHRLHGVAMYIYALYADVRIYTNKNDVRKKGYICSKCVECPLTTDLYT